MNPNIAGNTGKWKAGKMVAKMKDLSKKHLPFPPCALFVLSILRCRHQLETVKITGRSVLEKADPNGNLKQWKTYALFEIVTDAQSNWWMKLKAPTFHDHHEVYSKCEDELFQIRHLNNSLVGEKEVVSAGTIPNGVFPYDMTSSFGVLL